MTTSALSTKILRTVVAGALAATGTLLPAADPPGPRCGDVLSQDTVLVDDLLCPDGPGLVLADGVTLDLGGHRLVGAGREVPGPAVTNAEVEGQGRGVTVRNGVIDGWSQGAGFRFGSSPDSPHVVDGIEFRNVGGGVRSAFSPLRVERISVTDASGGVSAFFTTARVSDSTFSRLEVVGGANNGDISFTRSTMRDSRLVFLCTEAGCSAYSSEITGNERINQDWYGGGGYVDNLIAGNTMGIDMGDGGSSFGVAGNVFRGNGTAVNGGFAWWSVNEVRDNTFIGNGVAYQGWGVTDRLLDNTFVRNGDAVHVAEAMGLEVGGNRAYLNTGRGLHAEGQVVDLGDNRARGNGVEPQCLGVTCRP